jgi:hypothetical protein
MFFVGKGEKERVRMPCFARRKKSELACSLEIFGRKKKLTNLTTAAIGLRKKKKPLSRPLPFSPSRGGKSPRELPQTHARSLEQLRKKLRETGSPWYVRREAGRHLRGERQAVVLSLALSLHFGKSLFFSPTHQAFPRFSLSLSLSLSLFCPLTTGTA